MRFYHKQLNSLEELHRERERLRVSIGKSPHADVNPSQKDIGDEQQAGKGFDIAGILINILSHELVTDMLLKLGMPVIKKAGKFAGKSIFELGKEVLGGYAKWKALEIAYRWARRHWLKKNPDIKD